jgi:tetratricopeptide (TPR) repeat protein
MADHSRLEDLRRRVERDPASIAFAQLAEEYRRAHEYQQAVDVCQAGLALHPGYLSARVTLGRALIELNQLEDAQAEIEQVLRSAPENLAAIRGLAEIHHRRGERTEALAQYRRALALAPNDPDLEETVNDLERELAPATRHAHPEDGLSLEQVTAAFSVHLPPARREPAAPLAASGATPMRLEPKVMFSAPPVENMGRSGALVPEDIEPVIQWTAEAAGLEEPADEDDRDLRTVAALEAWLSAIHVARANRSSENAARPDPTGSCSAEC